MKLCLFAGSAGGVGGSAKAMVSVENNPLANIDEPQQKFEFCIQHYAIWETTKITE